VGLEPGKIEISGDGGMAYVSMDREGTVLQLDVATFEIVRSIVMGQRSSVRAQDVAVAPDLPETIAIARKEGSRFVNLSVWDSGAARPTKPVPSDVANSLAFGATSDVLYGFGHADRKLRHFRLDPQGVHMHKSLGAFGVANDDITFAGGLVHFASGDVVDPVTATRVGRVAVGAGAVLVPDAGARRTYAVFGGQLVIYSWEDFGELTRVDIPGLVGTPRKLVRFGDNGLALLTAEQLITLRAAGIGNGPIDTRPTPVRAIMPLVLNGSR
jgi:hypothetical protein